MSAVVTGSVFARLRRMVVAVLLTASTAVAVLVVHPVSAHAATGPSFKSYTGVSFPRGMVTGPTPKYYPGYGNMWAVDYGDNSISQITPAGVITDYSAPGVSLPYAIAAGSNGNLWFTNQGDNSIGRITPAGVITIYTNASISSPVGIAAGSDGNLWFTNFGNNTIGRITPAGAITHYSGAGISRPDLITVGPAGTLWFTDYGNNTIGEITTAGVVSNYTGSGISGPQGITLGPDGNVWFTNAGNNSIGKITTTGTITVSNYTSSSISAPSNIVSGLYGELWFTNYTGDSLGSIDTAGDITRYPLGAGAKPIGITLGTDGAMWYADAGTNTFGRYVPVSVSTAQPTQPSAQYQYYYTPSRVNDLTSGPDRKLWFTGNSLDIYPNGVAAMSADGSNYASYNTGYFNPQDASKPPSRVSLGAIATGSDGNLWAIDAGYNQYGTWVDYGQGYCDCSAPPSIDKITTAGAVTKFPIGQAASDITNGPDGNIWFTDGNQIGKITSGNLSWFTIPIGSSPHTPRAYAITNGPDGGIWFTDDANNLIERMSTYGVVTNSYSSSGISDPTAITSGPDGALWFTNNGNNTIGRISTSGVVTDFSGLINAPSDIVTGPDDNLWFTSPGNNAIGRITTAGSVTVYTDPTINAPTSITVGSDGALWFNNAGVVLGRLSLTPSLTTYANAVPNPTHVTLGPDGNLWATTPEYNWITRVSPTGAVTDFGAPSISNPSDIVTGPDGNLWFTNKDNNTIGKITPTGAVSKYSNASINSPSGITTGSDGRLWFTNTGSNTIGAISTSGAVSVISDPTISAPLNITTGDDGALWFTNSGNNTVGRVTKGGAVSVVRDSQFYYPDDITAGSDGALWVTNFGGATISRITTSGVVTDYTDPSILGPEGITTGPDGNLWFTDPTYNTIGEITTSGAISNVTDPNIANPSDITTGPNGVLWFTNSAGMLQSYGSVAPTPTITSLPVMSGPPAGGSSVMITGTGLWGATNVKFGTVAATRVTVSSPTQIFAVAPAGTAGTTVDVSVTTVGGTSAVVPADKYTYAAAPTVTSLSSTAGPTAGGSSVTITGTSFIGVTMVRFGSIRSSNFTVNSPTQITAITPIGTAGSASNVTVTTPSGTSATSTATKYTYTGPPAISSFSPTAGPVAGGTTVVISGASFNSVTAVDFGHVAAAKFTVNSANQITAITPAGTAGTVIPSVTNGAGTGTAGAGTPYTYADLPTTNGRTPTSGGTAGGTAVTIYGTALTGATTVKFGSVPATSFTVNSATQISATAPAQAAGTVDITVTTPGGTTAVGTWDRYTFTPPTPTVTAVSRNAGTTSGGATVLITGTGFTGTTGAAGVKFGGINATSYTITSDTQISAITPANSQGLTYATITTAGGTSANSIGAEFYYWATPAITGGISPRSGPPSGGTSVLIDGTNFNGATAVTFGGMPAKSFTINSPGQITAITPAGSPGPAAVVVTGPGGSGTSRTSFTYGVAPIITTVTHASGPIGGNVQITLIGTGFSTTAGATSFSFAGNPATSVQCSSTSSCTAVVPAGPVLYPPGTTTETVGILATVAGVDSTNPTGYTYYAPGWLTVTTNPSVPSQILLDGHVADTTALRSAEESPGQHTLCFQDVPGYIAPPCQTLTITAGQTTTIQGTFTQFGGLHVTLSPAVHGEISINGTPANDGGLNDTTLPAGSYQICFAAVAGYNPPPCQTVNVTAGVTTSTTAAYTANSAATGQSGVGRVSVSTTSTGTATPLVIVDGAPADTGGLNGLELPAGNHTICFQPVPDYTTPPCQAINVLTGNNMSVTGSYTHEGTLQVQTAPSPGLAAAIYLNGDVPTDDWALNTALPAGSYTVCFGAVSGHAAPGCQTATLTAGATTKLTGTYG